VVLRLAGKAQALPLQSVDWFGDAARGHRASGPGTQAAARSGVRFEWPCPCLHRPLARGAGQKLRRGARPIFGPHFGWIVAQSFDFSHIYVRTPAPALSSFPERSCWPWPRPRSRELLLAPRPKRDGLAVRSLRAAPEAQACPGEEGGAAPPLRQRARASAAGPPRQHASPNARTSRGFQPCVTRVR
jgi:hypothetical protein